MNKGYKRWAPQADFTALFPDLFFFPACVRSPASCVWIVTALSLHITWEMGGVRSWVSLGCLPKSSKPLCEEDVRGHHAFSQTIELPGHGTLFLATTCPPSCSPPAESRLQETEELGAVFRNHSESSSESLTWPHSFGVLVRKQQSVVSSSLFPPTSHQITKSLQKRVSRS